MKNLLLTSETEGGSSCSRCSHLMAFFFLSLLVIVEKKDKLKAMMSVLCVPNFKRSNVGDSTVQRSVFPITKQSTSVLCKACVALYLPNNQTWETNKELFVMTSANAHNVIIDLKQWWRWRIVCVWKERLALSGPHNYICRQFGAASLSKAEWVLSRTTDSQHQRGSCQQRENILGEIGPLRFI